MPEKENEQASPEKATAAQPAKSNNKLIIIVVIVVGVLAVLSGIGYFANQFLAEKVTEKAIETATGGKVNVDADKEKVTIETNDGKLTIGQNEIPKSFPSDITVYKGAKVTSSAETDEGLSVQLTTNDSASTVYDFYRNDLKENGWKETSNSTYGDTSMVSAEKSGKSVLITVSKDTSNDGTVISIVYSINP